MPPFAIHLVSPIRAPTVIEGKVRRRRPENDPERLKALGNAVVPQVAYVVGIWALRLMLSDEMPRRQGATP